jgi:TPR repeat protein
MFNLRYAFLAVISVACASQQPASPQNPHPAEPLKESQPVVDSPKPASPSVEELKASCTLENPDPCVQLCDRSVASGCYIAALSFQKRPPETRDDARSLAIYQRGCSLGSMEACGNLGLMFEKGRGTTPDLAHARELYEKVCAAGVPVHCRNVGRLCEGAPGIAADADCSARAYARALQLATDQCESGKFEGCAVAGFMYRDGKGTSANETEARTLLSKACNGGYKWACAPDPFP